MEFAPPTWSELAHGARPPSPPAELDPSDWGTGWQHEVASRVEAHHRASVIFPKRRREGESIAQVSEWTVGKSAFLNRSTAFVQGFVAPLSPLASPSQLTCVDVAACRTPLATIAQRAPREGCWPQDVTRQDHRQGQNFKPPEECAAAARARIPQLEAALAALGNSTGPEVVALQQALKKAHTVERMSTVCREEREEDCLYRPRTGSRDEVARGRQGPFGATQEGGRNCAARATDCATDSSKHFWGCPEVAGNGGTTSIREGRVVEEEGQSTVARRFRVCVRRGSDPMAGRSPERYERCIDGGERWGSGQDGCSRERGHQSVEAVDWAIWCRRECHASVHGGEHRPVSQKLRLVVHRCGFLGCRVGEASNPGPVQTRQARRAEHDRLTARRQTQVDVSSDEEEPIVRPNIGRHVVARTNLAHGSVDDSDDAPVGRGTQIRTGESGVPDAFVGTPSMLVSCPAPDVGFTAPRKKLRIRKVRESQASTVVAVESSEPSLCPVPRMPSVDSVSPQVQVERAGSQVTGFAMGRFAVFATEVEDDGVRVGEGVHRPGFTNIGAVTLWPCHVLFLR